MSINRKQSDFVGTPSQMELLAFAKTMTADLAAIGMTPERAVDSEKVRPMLVDYYWKVQHDDKSAKEAKAEDAAVDLFKSKLGITPEVEKFQSVKSWVLEFGKDTADEMPMVRTDEAQNYVCGLPDSVPCCDKKHVVAKWAILEGTFYGICDNAAGAYSSVTEELGRKPRLKYTESLDTAKQIAQTQQQDKPITLWVYSFAYDKAEDLPVERKDAEDKYLCGLPDSVPCCDKKQAAARYAARDGVAYGLCEKASQIYFWCFSETGIKSVKSAGKLEEAQKIAASQAKDKPLFQWVEQFATLAAEEYPGERKLESGQHACGIPESVGCCDHTQSAERYAAFSGEVYGLCQRANWGYRKVGGRLGGDPNCLKSTDDLEKIEKIASYQRGNNGEPSDTPCSPLGNKTEPDSRRRSDQRKSRKSAESKARYEAKPKPNQGSGDIAAQSMGKGNKK